MAGVRESLLAGRPFVLTLTRRLVRFSKSRTNTSVLWLLSLATRLVALLENATQRPSSLMHAVPVETDVPPKALAVPKRSRVTSVVIPETMSRTNRSMTPLRSFRARLLARLSNKTKRPSGVIPGQEDGRLPEETPVVETLTRAVVPATRPR